MMKRDYGDYTRLTIKEAKEHFISGGKIRMVASNLSPENFFGLWHDVKNPGYLNADEEFEKVVNAFRYYNCNAETGKTVRFYKHWTEDIF